jgi:uncharacterized protein YkwD
MTPPSSSTNRTRRCQLRTLFLFACVMPVLTLPGCGGSGSDTSQTAPPAEAPAASPATPVELSVCGLSGFADRALTRINQLRAAGVDCGTSGKFAATTPVTWNTLLTRAADAHSKDMAANNFFSHTSLDGRDPGARITATGYAWRTYGENIAAGYATVDSVMDGWTASPGHCANLMNPAFTEVGLACVPGSATTTYGNYWTMDLAAPR